MRTEVGAAQVFARMTGGGVLVVEFRGPITSGAMLDELKRPIAAQVYGKARAVLADYAGAALALSDAEILLMMAGGEPHNLPDLPAGVVASPDAHGRMRHAAFMAGFMGGFTRIICADPCAAMRAISVETESRF